MSMIHETALENRSATPDLEIDAAAPAVQHSWRIGRLVTCTAGLIVAVAVGNAAVGSAMRQWARPAADVAPDRTVHAVVAAAVDKPAEKPPQAAESVALGQTAVGGIETGTASAAEPDEPPAAKAETAPPIESVAPGVKAETGSEAGTPVFTTVTHTEAVAPSEAPPDEEPPADAPVSPTIVTGSIGKGQATIRIGRIISDVNMRAGPSNGQPVLATLPRGSAVEVIGCRAWCEVVVSGQRGWIYKGFLGASDVARER